MLTSANSFLLLGGFYVCAIFGENRSRNATVIVPWDGHTHWQTDRPTEENRYLANENSRSRSLYVIVRPSVCRLSVVCNVRAPYSGDWNFRQCFYAMWYHGHPWPLYENFTEIVPGEHVCRGLNPRGVAKYSDFWPFEGYISETMQDMIYVSINH